MTLKVGALFAGYGGIELALGSVLDTEPAWFSEFDKAPSAILAHHWPDVPNLGDVTKIDWAAVEPVDIITGGSPCQDLSHAGKRAGMKAGTRSGLWASMCDAIDIIRPRLVVWENVQGALSAEAASALMPSHFDDSIRWHLAVAASTRSDHVRKLNQRAASRLMEYRARRVGTAQLKPVLRALGRVLGDLAELGYDARWYGLRAADVGAAHGRFRVFLFAAPANTGSLGWGEGSSDWAGPGTATRGGEAGRTGGHPLLGTDAAPDLTLLPTPAVNDMGAAYTPETWDAWTERMKAEHGNGNGHGKSLNIEALRLPPTPTTVEGTGPGSHGTGGDNLRTVVDALLPTPRATDGTKGGPNQRGSSGDLSPQENLLWEIFTGGQLLPTPNVADAVKGGYEHKGGNPTLRGATEDPAREQDWREYEAAIRRQEQAFGRPAPLPTEPGAKGQPRLSPAFVEWLMGLPAGHVTDPAIGISRNDQLKALGNGVVPQQCAAALRAFLTDTSKENAA